MYHVFICYPRTYLAEVSPLHDALELALRNIYQRDAQVFQDTSDLQAGNKWATDVDTALEQARVMIVVVVPTILESPQCRREMMRFIDTPGKHIIPLICEKVPRLQQLAAGVDTHPEGSEDHEIAICAQALQTWQAYDFSQAVYQNPNETTYKIAVVELARMIRNKLDHEDHAANAPAEPKPEPPPPQDRETVDAPGESGASDRSGEKPRDATPAGAGEAGTSGGTSRRGLLVAALVAVLAAGGVGLWAWMTPSAPVEPAVSFDRSDAETVLTRVLSDAAAQADHLDFDPETDMLTVTAPALGQVATDIPLQPAIDPMLSAGFMPGFVTTGDEGDTCFIIDGGPLALSGTALSDGDTVSFRLGVFERTGPQPQRICTTARSTWQSLPFTDAVGAGNGSVFTAPSEDARRLRRLFAGEEVSGPFWTHRDLPGWVRFEHRGQDAFVRRDLLKERE